ncbi:unnamed protein product [Aspergillus oryzae var. brunneus]|uniref:Unnamed protein product n=1 Tax=Aspergillus oryzae var. brunneus TaxID=332754 RepID=A0ABQ6KXP8_ASPOZ|nr:unnamed protein product [Aspergillus oryzae var. brunneus]
MPVNAVQNISRPAADRFAENYNLPSCEARKAMITPAASVPTPSATSRKDRVQTNDDAKSTSSLLSTSTSSSQEGTSSMVVKKNPLQRIAMNSSYLGRRVLNWVVEVPMGVTLLFSQFTHNVPRCYNDRTVRELPEVTGVRSGLLQRERSRIRQGVAESKAASQEEKLAVLEKWSTYEKGVRLKHQKNPR